MAGICLRKNKTQIEALILKRNPQKKIYPGLWECGGGQVNPGEAFREAVEREMEEELGVKVSSLMAFRDYQVVAPSLPQRIIPGIIFICVLEDSRQPLKLSPEHSEYRWIDRQTLTKSADSLFIKGLKEEISQAMTIGRKLSLL